MEIQRDIYVERLKRRMGNQLSIFTLESHRFHASEPPRIRIFTLEGHHYMQCVRFSFSAPLHELSWRFPAICHVGFHGIKAYLSIAAHACERFAQCSNTIYSMTDIDKWLENAVQPSCSGFEKENLPPDSRLWQLYSNPHIVCPMLSSLQISGWLSSVKTVALKCENIQLFYYFAKKTPL